MSTRLEKDKKERIERELKGTKKKQFSESIKRIGRIEMRGQRRG